MRSKELIKITGRERICMICKIWPIKENKHTGIVGALNDSKDYIEDKNKTSIEISEIQELENGYLLGATDIAATLAYMQNEDKVMKKYVSGINCDPDLAVEQWMEVKERNLARVGKTLEDDTCNHAFHLVQSFEDDPKLTPDLVHQCGIELAKKLGYYQAVVCTHIPGDYEGSGAHYHNHILFNSHSYDPEKQFGSITKMKYNDCKETYQQLREWNDEIALEHKLSIIREPENSKSFSWYEWNLSKSGESWKEQVRLDIENTKAVSRDWTQFKMYLESAGYTLREGKYITYTTPEGKKVRDNKLGKQFTKDSLDTYWIEKAKINQELDAIKDPTINKKKNLNEYYFSPKKCSTKTKKPYAVKCHDKFGRRRSTLELTIMLAAVIIKNEAPKITPEDSPSISRTDWKLQQMIDAVKIARETEIGSIEELGDKLTAVGKRGNNLKTQLNRYHNNYNKMETLAKAIESYKEVKGISEQIREMPEGPTKDQEKKDHAAELQQYKESKAIMYRYKVSTEEEIDDFTKRFETLKKNIATTEDRLAEMKEEYRKLKKLEYQTNLAQNHEYCYGSEIINKELTKEKSQNKER